MKAIVVHQYGGPEVLKFEEYPDPVPGPGEVLVRVAATSVNPTRLQATCWINERFLPHQVSGTHRSRYRGHCGQDWAGSGRLFCRRPGVRYGGQYLRRTLCRESCDSGESSQGSRFDPGGGVAAGDDDWQPAPLSYGNQSGPDGSRRRCCWKCRAFGGIHREGTRGDCDRGGFEEADGRCEDSRRGSGRCNRRRHRDCESSAARCGGGCGRRKNRREADRQGQAGRSLCIGCRGTAERRGVPYL